MAYGEFPQIGLLKSRVSRNPKRKRGKIRIAMPPHLRFALTDFQQKRILRNFKRSDAEVSKVRIGLASIINFLIVFGILVA